MEPKIVCLKYQFFFCYSGQQWYYKLQASSLNVTWLNVVESFHDASRDLFIATFPKSEEK
jgi:hypothetical protein